MKRKVKLLKNNPYRYRVDISQPDALELYWRYKKWKGIPPMVSAVGCGTAGV